MKLVVHVITDLTVGGAESMLVRLLQAGPLGRFEQAVVSLMDEGALGQELDAAGIPVEILGLRRGGLSLPAVSRLRNILNELGPDLVQGWMYHGNLAATVGAWLAGSSFPVLWNIRQSLYGLKNEKPLTRVVIRASSALSRLPAAIIYNSKVAAQQHQRMGFEGGRNIVIPNGFDCDQLRPDAQIRKKTRAQLGIPDKAVLVGMIARYHPMKGHDEFIRAVGRLSSRRDDVQAVLVGPNVDGRNEELTSIIAQCGLDDRTVLLGERRDIGRLLNAFDVLCSSSQWGEGFSNVIGEAMAVGVPCVVTDIGDSGDMVGDAGIVVPADDVAALAAGLEKVVDADVNSRREMGCRARQRVKDNYALRTAAERYANLYEDTLTAWSGRQRLLARRG